MDHDSERTSVRAGLSVLPVLNPRLLVVHRTVLQAGTLTAAAAALGYTVSGVSQQLAALEREVGQPLWEKVGRGVRPTPAGLLLAERSEQILNLIEEIEADLEDLRLGRHGRLRVVSFHSAGESLLPSAIATLHESLPGITVLPVVDEAEGALHRLRAGEVEAVVVVEPYGRGEAPEDDLHRTHLLDDQYRILLHDEHPLARRRIIDVADLADTGWIIAAGPSDYVRDTTVTLARRAGYTPRVVAEADDFNAAQGYVSVGLGVCLAPLLALGAVRRHVIVRSLRQPPDPRHIWLITRPALRHQASLRGLTAALRTAARSADAPR
jgi:DNA-binding transcriptional LysR family regulator